MATIITGPLAGAIFNLAESSTMARDADALTADMVVKRAKFFRTALAAAVTATELVV